MKRIEINVNDQLSFLKHKITRISNPDEEDKEDDDMNFSKIKEEEKAKSNDSMMIEEIYEEDHLDEKILDALNKNIGKQQIVIERVADEKVIEFSDDKNINTVGANFSTPVKELEKGDINFKIRDSSKGNTVSLFKTMNGNEVAEAAISSTELDKYNNQIRTFLKKLKNLCEINIQAIMISFKLYSVISRKYIINPKIREVKQNNEENMRISKANIPHKKNLTEANPVEMKKLKNKILNPGDSNFKILLTMIMGVQKTVQSTPNIEVNIKKDMTGYIKSMKYSLGEAFINIEEVFKYLSSNTISKIMEE